jgi:hypothetical protein
MTSHKRVAHFEATQREFPCMGNVGVEANRHGNMSCFGDSLVLVLVNQKPHATKHEPRNLPPIETCQVSMGNPTHVSMFGQPKPLKHIPTKSCNVLGSMFGPHAPILHVPPCDPHPCPMTHPWRFKPFSIFPHFI